MGPGPPRRGAALGPTMILGLGKPAVLMVRLWQGYQYIVGDGQQEQILPDTDNDAGLGCCSSTDMPGAAPLLWLVVGTVLF